MVELLRSEVISIRKETNSLNCIQMTKPRDFSHVPGQYLQIFSQNGGGGKHLAIASHPDENFLEFLINTRDANFHDLCLLPVGSAVEISHALGQGFSALKFTGKTVYLVSHGSGISAMKPFIQELRKNRNLYGSIRFIYGVRTHLDFPYRNLLRDWMGSIELYDIISQNPDDMSLWTGETGRVQDVLAKIKPSPENSIAAIVGSPNMEKDIISMLTGFGFKPEQILLNH
ncbi:MAG: hypothetical protein OEV66_05645 [Spirochaetia bacterium]|nr:hypothetical protein [Spirochaetia bacterium]